MCQILLPTWPARHYMRPYTTAFHHRQLVLVLIPRRVLDIWATSRSFARSSVEPRPLFYVEKRRQNACKQGILLTLS